MFEDRDARGRRIITIGQALRPLETLLRERGRERRRPDWIEARPAAIQRALARALGRPSGGWYVVDATRRIGARPVLYRIDGRELVAWRAADGVRLAPDACPHMGASLATGFVREGRLVCPWHGLELDGSPHGRSRWCALESYDDGLLTWVRLGPADPAVPRPILPERPSEFLDGVIRMEARCEPSDVIANRLDPWHGAHLHPYSFARLRVLDETQDRITLRVAFRVLGPVCIEVDCSFHCPEPRTIVMTILDGEGAGSLVETHATPIAPGRTAIIEATLATSSRPGFARAQRLTWAARPLIERIMRRLWVDDAAYAERTYELRSAGASPATLAAVPDRPGPG
ncbi:MAG TPA: DUF5914 domain-containing protein [Polyangia bacterium]|jgi:isorenieratene synthase|nr:DUF5914 domain-containing protein [Polyangia bacterium]